MLTCELGAALLHLLVKVGILDLRSGEVLDGLIVDVLHENLRNIGQDGVVGIKGKGDLLLPGALHHVVEGLQVHLGHLRQLEEQAF